MGIDLENIGRFQTLTFEKNGDFYRKIFTPQEIKYCLKFANPYPHFAARFCAKEAFIKASGKKIGLKKIEIILTDKAPRIKIHRNSGKKFRRKIHLSISHTKTHAFAAVVIA